VVAGQQEARLRQQYRRVLRGARFTVRDVLSCRTSAAANRPDRAVLAPSILQAHLRGMDCPQEGRREALREPRARAEVPEALSAPCAWAAAGLVRTQLYGMPPAIPERCCASSSPVRSATRRWGTVAARVLPGTLDIATLARP
jgi:hypothetical protein